MRIDIQSLPMQPEWEVESLFAIQGFLESDDPNAWALRLPLSLMIFFFLECPFLNFPLIRNHAVLMMNSKPETVMFA